MKNTFPTLLLFFAPLHFTHQTGLPHSLKQDCRCFWMACVYILLKSTQTTWMERTPEHPSSNREKRHKSRSVQEQDWPRTNRDTCLNDVVRRKIRERRCVAVLVR